MPTLTSRPFAALATTGLFLITSATATLAAPALNNGFTHVLRPDPTLVASVAVLPVSRPEIGSLDRTKPGGRYQLAHEIYDEQNRFGHPGKAGAVTRTIKIEARDGVFAPDALTVKLGETIRFEIRNTGQLDHEFMIGDKREQTEHDQEMTAMPGMVMQDPNGVSVPPGQTATLIWTFSKKGNFEYGCHVPGHYVAGMFGRLNVQRASGQ